MVSQTSNYGTVETAQLQGGRLLVQFGHAKWVAKLKKCTLATTLEYVKSAQFTWRSGRPGVAKSSGLAILTSGTVTSGSIKITRATLGGGTSGGTFWYELIGW